jgi:hypothetical protein
MAKNNKKNIPATKKIVTAAKRAVAKTVTEVRNTAIPKLKRATKAGLGEVSYDQVAKRAYEIYASGNGGSETDNWLRAERELRAGL